MLLSISLLTTCNGERTADTDEGLSTRLLVGPPAAPLKVNQPIDVRSSSQDPNSPISHVELIAVQLPDRPANLLIRSDVAPFPQTNFTASQIFVPRQTGRYVIKVVGYNIKGNRAESDPIGFEVVP